MAGDRARVSYDATRKWRGAVAQQGRVTVEADINEAATIEAERDRLTTLDVVGPVGTPDGGYAVSAFGSGSTAPDTPGDLQVSPGTLYLGGLRLDLDETVTYSNQPDWLDHTTDPLWTPPAIPSSNNGPPSELITLRAIEIEASATEDPALADVALGGPDTMARRRILQHIRRQPISASNCADALTEFAGTLNGLGLTFDEKSMRLGSTTSLQVSFTNTVSQPSPCEPTATGGYLGAENQLIRVMVYKVENGVPGVVWGFDNASFLYRLSAATFDSNSKTTTVTLASSPADSFHFPGLGQAVELLRDCVQLTTPDYIASPTGFVSELTAAYDPTQMQLVIDGQPPDDYFSATPQLYLRVWQGTAAAPTGQAISLGDTGVAVTLSSSGQSFNVGDFWTFAVRPINPALVYPQRYLDAPQPPEGPRTWLAPLAVLTWSDGEADIVSCVPSFENLVALARANSCGCTVTVGPSDVADGAGLAPLVASYAGRQPVTICLEPGRYTLSEPIVLGAGLDTLTLRGCAPGAILAAPESPGPEFSLGLVVVQGQSTVTIEGLAFELPMVGFAPASSAFNGLVEPNQELMTAFTAGLQVAFGISAADAASLTVQDCTFSFSETASSVFGAAIYATGQMTDLRLTGCTFRGVPQQLDVTPFNDLAAGNPTQPPYQLSFGYLQVPTAPITETGSTSANVVLHDATIEKCLFQGPTVPVLAMARLGTIRVDQNIVRDSYGGIWLVSLAGDQTVGLLDEIAIGNPGFYNSIASEGLATLLDRIFVMALAMGLALPTTPPSNITIPIGRILIPLSEEHRALARETFAAVYASATERAAPAGASPAAGSAPARSAAKAAPTAAKPAVPDGIPEQFNFIFEPRPILLGPAIPTAETGSDLILRLDVCDCQIDAIVANSYSAGGLVVLDFTQSLGSALVHGCRIRTRFPQGEAATLFWITEATVTGNIIANEVVPPPPDTEGSHPSYSITMLPLAPYGFPAVAITGNVFIDPVALPGRPQTIPVPLNVWDILNTVIAYVAPPAVSGLSPATGNPGGGDVVTITGTGLTNATTVNFGSASASAVTPDPNTPDTQLTATSPPGNGTVDVTVTTPAGTSAINQADQFTYVIPRPGPRPFPGPVRFGEAEPGAGPQTTTPDSPSSESPSSEGPSSEGPSSESTTSDSPSSEGPSSDNPIPDKPISDNPISDKRISGEGESGPKLPESKPRPASRTPSTAVTRPMKRPDPPSPDQPSPPPADS